jgi:proteic killer suppression protein
MVFGANKPFKINKRKLASNYPVRRFITFERNAQSKLMQLKAAETLDMLRTLQEDPLEPLKSDRKGQFSIRINGQWRPCFRFENGHVQDVEIVDYH